jgi:hypothetical protein
MKTMIDLTDRFPMTFDVPRMREELASLEGADWLPHYDKALAEGWTAIPLVSRDGSMDSEESQRVGTLGAYRRTPVVEKLPYFAEILDAFPCPQGRVRIMKMMPGTVINPHRDVEKEVANIAFGQVRLHVPIETNDDVVFVVGGERLRMEPGRLYYVNFSKTHYVRNDGSTVRTHLVLDLGVDAFLARVFPPPSAVERLDRACVRALLPLQWKTIGLQNRAIRVFWRTYEGSALQRLRHRLRGGRPA